MAQKQESSTLKANEPSRPQFYRRKLPETCISFSSDEGKKIFREALTSGHMDCYFKVAAQFRTQDEPAFCGLSTLVMVLNALEIDPEKVWKGPWRWYHENMLDCCVPVKVIEQEGITFGQFICLAECNGLETTATYIDENASLQLFRNDIIRYTKQDDSLITLTYSRKVLKQTGDGHFSPVAGYHPDRDLVLMMDTARFKYPPHWIPLPLLFEAMQAKDKTTGKSRGYMVMKKQTQSGLLLFRISGSFGVTLKNACSESLRNMLNSWKAWLCQSIDKCGSVEKVIGSAVEWLLKSSCLVPAGQLIFTTQLDIKCLYDLSDQHFCVIKSLIMELEKNTIFEIVSEALRNETSNFNLDMFGNLSVATSISSGEPVETKCKRRCLQDLQPSHFLAMFILSWPYHSVAIKHDTNACVLNEYVCKLMTSVDTKYLGNEVRTLRKQFTALFVSFNECCGNTCSGSC